MFNMFFMLKPLPPNYFNSVLKFISENFEKSTCENTESAPFLRQKMKRNQRAPLQAAVTIQKLLTIQERLQLKEYFLLFLSLQKF